jgi:hypothetical protein
MGKLSWEKIQKLMNLHSRLTKAGFGSRSEIYMFRLDLLGLELNWAFKNLESPLSIKRDEVLKTIVIEGEGNEDFILYLLNTAMTKLKRTKCVVVKAQLRDLWNNYYICVLEDGRVICDISSK